MTQLDERTPLGLVKGAYTTRTELRLPDDIEYDDWVEIGRQLVMLRSASAWWIGDWFHYGQWEYGERKIEAFDLGLDYDAARNKAYVAGRFKLSRRRDNLSFAHHQEVAALDPLDRDSWLDRAEQHGWTRNELRERIREARALGKTSPAPIATVVFKVTAPPEQHERWQQAAGRAGLTINDWAIVTLDIAASQLLAAA